MKTLNKGVAKNEKWIIIAFIALSTLVMGILESPAKLLVLAGSLNGIILPITLGICLIASQKKAIMGKNYKHPRWLFICGILVVIITSYLGIQSLSGLSKLF